jgi:hypothetical protein
MMVIVECEQQSKEWFDTKVGIPSAASFDQIITTKGEPSKSRQKYMYQLSGEIILGNKVETYTNAAMQRGNELEPEARQAFEFIHDVQVRKVGFVFYDEQKKYGCSPDGLMTDTGLEMKCPLLHTHIGYLLDNKLPTDYFQQVQGGMFITGFKYWYFMSYYPGLPPLILTINRDEKFIDKLKAELDSFCLELSTVVEKLKNL